MLAAMRVMPKYSSAGPPVTGYVGWWDASDATSIASSGGLVSQWNDKSGNARHLTQGTDANKPNTGVNSLNGLNTIAYSATTHALSVSSSFTVGTLYVAMYLRAVPSAYNSLLSGNGSSTQMLSAGGAAAAAPYKNNFYVFGGGSALGPTSYGTSTAYVLTVLLNGGSGSLLAKNGVDGTTFSTTMGAITSFTVGKNADSSPTWDVGEVVAFTSKHGSTDRDAMESYLGAKWGVTIS